MHKVISVGYGRHLFETGSRELERLIRCADAVVSYDMVIFSKRAHGCRVTAPSSKLTLYPTNSRNNFLALFDAFFIARALIKQSSSPITLTTQDPFETALLGILLKRLYPVRLVIQEHGDFFGTPHWRRESLFNRVRYYFGLWALKQADVVRVVSKRGQAHLAAKGIRRCRVLPVAIDTAFSETSEASSVVSTMFGTDTFVFLSAARFVPQKNLPLLLRAFFRAHQTAPHIRLLLVGQGAEQPTLEACIRDAGPHASSFVRLLPWSDDIPGLMKASSAYVLSSNYEGWGRVLIEAMVAHVPIVTTAVGCAEEVVEPGRHGLVVPIADEDALAQALSRLATDTSLYRDIKQNLQTRSVDSLPGTDSDAYAETWAQIFGQE